MTIRYPPPPSQMLSDTIISTLLIDFLCRNRMLLRNAHWILLAVCLLLVYVFYTASDESPTGVANAGNGKAKDLSLLTEGQTSHDETSGSGMFARLQALKPKLLPIMSQFSSKAEDSQNSNKVDVDKSHGKKPISPLIMGKTPPRLKTIR